MSYLVGNPEDRFSRTAAHMSFKLHKILKLKARSIFYSVPHSQSFQESKVSRMNKMGMEFKKQLIIYMYSNICGIRFRIVGKWSLFIYFSFYSVIGLT